MTTRPDNRLSQIAELLDTGAILQARSQLDNLTEQPVANLVRGETAIYFDQLAEADSLLAHTAGELATISEVARFARAEGELLFARHDFEAAAGRFEAAGYLNSLLKSRFGQAWALYGRARVARVLEQYAEAEQYLAEARDLLKLRLDGKGEYLHGLLNFNLALVQQCTGQLSAAEQIYQTAIEQLRRTESCRYFGLALVGCGTLKRTSGQYAAAVPLFEEAIALFRQHELNHDLSQTLTILGQTQSLLKQSDEAERQLTAAAELCARQNDAEGQSAALISLGELFLRRRLLPKAQQAIERALEAARQAGNGFHEAGALIAQARTMIVLKEPQKSVELLQRALELARQNGSSQQQAQCYIYLAEAYHAFQIAKGQEAVAEAAKLIEGQYETWLKAEFEAVVAKYKRERVIISDDNKFIIDGSLLPEWEDAKRGLEIFLLRNALKQADNNLTQAGKLLGISKVHVHTRRKQYDL